VARNRKRAKERRARRPEPVATARGDRQQAAPDPIEHAAPDAELAEAQLALGRPELAEEPEPDDEDLEFDSSGGGGRVAADGDFDGDAAPSGELVAHGGLTPEAARRPGNRLVNFLRGSWRELQRVQWPDRRQVMQATGVVIGFVIVAGLFLGAADFLAGKLMNYILR
jgi:preprotein translocase subunit SecE